VGSARDAGNVKNESQEMERDIGMVTFPLPNPCVHEVYRLLSCSYYT
jgi:hypothetical protein